MKRREAGGVDSCAEVESNLVPFKKSKITCCLLPSDTTIMCRYMFMLPLDTVYNIMRHMDLSRFRAMCCIIFDMYKITLLPPDAFSKNFESAFSTSQIEILRRTSEILDEINPIRSGTWMRPLTEAIINKFNWMQYGDTYSCIEVNVDQIQVDLKSIQESIRTMKESQIMNFCYSKICEHCNVRNSEKFYYKGTPECISLCIYCYRAMQNTMFTDDIDSKTLLSGHAWVSQKVIKNALLIKVKSLEKWLIENNIRTRSRAFDIIITTNPPRNEFYLLSDVIEAVNKSRKSVYFVSHTYPPSQCKSS